MPSPSEREFLQLAGVYFACRWAVMGHRIPQVPAIRNFDDLSWHMLGMHDYQWAMRDFVKKWKLNPRHSERYRAP